MARDVLADVAKFKNVSVSYQNEQVTMVPKGGSAPGGAIVLNSTTGLIGIEMNGDTRGNDWYFDLQMLAMNQPSITP